MDLNIKVQTTTFLRENRKSESPWVTDFLNITPKEKKLANKVSSKLKISAFQMTSTKKWKGKAQIFHKIFAKHVSDKKGLHYGTED